MVLIAIASGLAVVALRNPASTQLENEAARLSALFEAARSESRASGVAASWDPRGGSSNPDGFRFVGLPESNDLPTHWLATGVTAEVVGARSVILGPEPLIGPQRILLRLDDQRLVLATDGLGPFEIASEEPQARP